MELGQQNCHGAVTSLALIEVENDPSGELFSSVTSQSEVRATLGLNLTSSDHGSITDSFKTGKFIIKYEVRLIIDQN